VQVPWPYGRSKGNAGPASAPAARRQWWQLPQSETGNALVETALVLPVLLLLAVGMVGVGRLTHAQLGVAAVAREAARAAALADTPADALAHGSIRGREVAGGYGLDKDALHLRLDVSEFRRGGQIRVDARYDVVLGALPLLEWVRASTASTHVERVEPYRSRWMGGMP
jgi:hypothetical protein